MVRADLVMWETEHHLWNARLAALGGDPATLNLVGFRPLRLSREEDWSDWLAHLIETSNTGRFATNLFAGARTSQVRREVPLSGGSRRADLLLHWVGDKTATHVEVKVGDQSFEKTYETAQWVEQENPNTLTWRHLVLLLPAQVAAWNESAGDRTAVGVVTWEDVAVCLRRELWDGSELISWRVWAMTFCSAIEQTLLDLPHINITDVAGIRLQSDSAKNTVRRLPIMKQAREAKEHT